jgi:thymidylate synthase
MVARIANAAVLCFGNGDGVTFVGAATLGEAWLRTSETILEHGSDATYDGLIIKEIAQLTLTIDGPDPDDPMIAELGDPEWSAWMHANFFTPEPVAELGHARSYASRLFDYAGTGRDQLAWVAERLRNDSASRSATITTFEPLLDTSYIPCVSMLDFWAPAGSLELVVYAHSLDFGKKAYGNLVELARLQQLVAGELGLPVGRLTVLCKSAHLYEPEWALMAGLVAQGAWLQPGAGTA